MAADSSNSDLLQTALGGDSEAWAELMHRHSGLVWSIARRHGLTDSQAADVMQVTALRLIERAHQIRDPEKVTPWIASVARNECRRILRLREIPSSEPLDSTLSESAALDSDLLVTEIREIVLEALADSSPRCQSLLRMLFATENPSYEQLSADLGMPIGSIGPTRARCLNRLAEHPLIRGIRDGEADS